MKKSNSAFYGAIAFLVVVGCFIFTWKMTIPSYQTNQKEIAQRKVEIDYAKNKLDSLNTTKSNLAELGDIVNKMLVAIPGDKDAPNLITELEAIGKANNVTLPSIQISDGAAGASSGSATASSSSNSISVSFGATGKFEDLSNLIKALENDIRFMNIGAITMNKSESTDKTNSDAMSLTIQLTAFKRIDSSLSLSNTTNNLTGANGL